jgi:succinate dehydrogenase / fumarate reductase cytochrome b subunit
MALTGLVWSGFVLAHMSGNLLMFVSPDAYNQYGHILTSGKIIYVAEAVLVLSIITHIITAISLTKLNMGARSSSYSVVPKGEKAPSFMSKTMAPQGTLILAFIIFHIATFKYGTYYETTVDGVVMRDLYRLVVEAFAQPAYVCWYVVCLILLGFHLSHGISSLFQSLGIRNERTEPVLKKISFLYAVFVAVGFLSQPLYVFFFAR